ncbi:MAG: tRNA 2-thiouridine(34) synthase MnmA [Chloroflexi bacterium]|nr:tRNA 2-thiouridine(34) synthase MnmA [Chloroflexota bacterium]
MARVMVGMSGGVDSSVAAAMLQEEGHQVIGVTMRIWNGAGSLKEGVRHGCCGPGEEEDVEDARVVARALGIDFHVLDLRQEYLAEVLDYLRREYVSGRTPNPCVRCNRTVKFGALLRKARDSGIDFDYFATGHYARVEYDRARGRYLLKRARDFGKDQTYFLYALSQEQLGCLLFPLGDYTKEEVRRMASEFGLSVAAKLESQDFIAGGYSLLMGTAPAGPILDRRGEVLGEHRGIPFYTIGQRRGLGISAGGPAYVVAIDRDRNAIVVGGKEDLYQDELTASDLNWIAIEEVSHPIKVSARIRYRHREDEAMVVPLGDGKVRVKFAQPQMAIAPGQSIVFYDGAIVVGGGTIERAGQ